MSGRSTVPSQPGPVGEDAAAHSAATGPADGEAVPEGVRRFLSVLPGGADAAVWTISDLATRRAAAAVVTTLASQDDVAKLAQRWAGVGNAQRAGHLFEVMHAATFNRNAALRGAGVRAYVQAWTEGGSPTGKVDIRLRDGTTFRHVQAKLLSDPVRAARAVASPDYAGMRRLVPADQVEAINTVLDKALKRSTDGTYYAGYADASTHLTDTLDLGGIHSDPVTLGQAHKAARDPIRWANLQVARSTGRQIATGAAASAASGALFAGLTATAAETARARAGETSAGAAVITVTGAIARNAVRSGTVGALAQSIQVAAKAGALPAALGTGTIGAVLADAVTTIATAGIDYARGSIDAPELAARSASATTRTSLVWVGGLAGQTVIPVPVLGALLGGIAGQAAAVLVTQGFQLALSATRGRRTYPDRLIILAAEAITTTATAASLRALTHQLAVDHHAAFTDDMLPRLAALTTTLGSSQPGISVDGLTTLTTNFAAKPSMSTVDEFDQWMADRTATLTLDPNW
ncbi:hypothetical protein [Frankia sp. AgB32]|uniref:hypothetical protein n=1 Tax=Frankia sp. AgB32 TaxID=631119 RepID=UPI002010B85D|nr:hypothetical protein [Frankia sp. AgB32]MCK9893608.1 hypothetical protein [Frankia sp. AgB32]